MVSVGYDLANEIAVANAANMITFKTRTGSNRTSAPRVPDQKPAYEVDRLSDLLGILQANA